MQNEITATSILYKKLYDLGVEFYNTKDYKYLWQIQNISQAIKAVHNAGFEYIDNGQRLKQKFNHTII